MYLFEYDERFRSEYPDEFVFYNYHEPTTVPSSLKQSFDFVFSDPPHINPDAVAKYTQTMDALVKDPSTSKRILISGKSDTITGDDDQL